MTQSSYSLIAQTAESRWQVGGDFVSLPGWPQVKVDQRLISCQSDFPANPMPGGFLPAGSRWLLASSPQAMD